jgi:hypothetical protein
MATRGPSRFPADARKDSQREARTEGDPAGGSPEPAP